MDTKFFEVFQAGKYPQGEFTIADVKQIADNYDPNFCESPIWIGHPKMDVEPQALAWIGGCTADDSGKLYVWLSSMSDEFIHLIQTKKFKRVSVEFWKFSEKPGWYLYAIGLTNRGQITQLQPIELIHGGLKDSANFNQAVIQKASVLLPIRFTISKKDKKTFSQTNQIKKMNEQFLKFAAEHSIDITGLDDDAAFKKIAEFFDAEKKAADEKVAKFTAATQSLEDKIKEFEAKELLSIIELGIADKRVIAGQRDSLKEFGIKHGADELKKFIATFPVQNVYNENAVNKSAPGSGSADAKFLADNGAKLTFQQFIEKCRKNPAFANQFTDEEIEKIKKGE